MINIVYDILFKIIIYSSYYIYSILKLLLKHIKYIVITDVLIRKLIMFIDKYLLSFVSDYCIYIYINVVIVIVIVIKLLLLFFILLLLYMVFIYIYIILLFFIFVIFQTVWPH